jgi:hypothetical protein
MIARRENWQERELAGERIGRRENWQESELAGEKSREIIRSTNYSPKKIRWVL